MPYPTKPTNGAVYVTLRVVDVGTAETIHFAPGFNGRIKRATSCIAGAITGSDSTWKLQISGTDVTNGNATVAVSGSAAGVIDQCIPSALNAFASDQYISLVNAGESTGAAVMTVCIELDS